MSKSKIQEKFDAGESLNWFELVEWEKELLEEKRLAREEDQKTGQAQSGDKNVDQEPIQLKLEEADSSISEEFEYSFIPERPESNPLESLLEINEYKLEASEELPEEQAEDLLEQDEILVDPKSQNNLVGAVHEPKKPLSAADLIIVVEDDSDSDYCILLEDTSDGFPKPVKIQEMAGNTKPGTWLDINNDLAEWETEIPEPKTAVIQMRSETQKNGINENGPWDSEIIEEELIAGSIQEINWKDLPEKQLVLESHESFITDVLEHVENALEHPEPKADDGLDSARTESAGFGNEPRASTSDLLVSLPGPSKSLIADERKLKTSQKRKIHQVDENRSDVVENCRKLERKCKKSNQGEKASTSQLKSDENPNPPLNGKPKRNPENLRALNQKNGNSVTAKESRKSSSATKNAVNQKKRLQCDYCGKKIRFKRLFIQTSPDPLHNQKF
jgi:hypothetical protein